MTVLLSPGNEERSSISRSHVLLAMKMAEDDTESCTNVSDIQCTLWVKFAATYSMQWEEAVVRFPVSFLWRKAGDIGLLLQIFDFSLLGVSFA